MKKLPEELDDDVVLDRVTASLVEKPRTFAEVFSFIVRLGEPMPTLEQVDDALDILYDAGAIKEFKETRFGDRMRIFALKSEARTYIVCEYCNGVGFQSDQKRGMCPFCHGNGVYTPVWDDGSER